MTLTPSTIRLDLKCGKGAIAPGKKCHKGSAQKVQSPASSTKPSRRAHIENAVLKAGGNVGTTASALSLAATFSGKPQLANALGQLGSAASLAEGAAMISRGQRTGNQGDLIGGSFRVAGSAGLTDLIARKASYAAINGAAGAARSIKRRRRASQEAGLERAFRGPSAQRDSIWAEGFAP
jgi:hypothetical protein